MFRKAQAIRELVEAGFALVPLVPGAKRPVSDKWQLTRPDPLMVPDDFPDNYGIVLRPEIVVLDLDPRNFFFEEKVGGEKIRTKVDSIKLLEDALGVASLKEIPAVRVKTGGGGWHLMMRKPTDVQLRQEFRKQFPGVQVLSFGHHIVGPGCIHPDTGKKYVKYDGVYADIPPAPEKLLELFARNPKKESRFEHPGIGAVDDRQTVERFKQRLDRMGNATQGNRDNMTYEVACVGREMGLSEVVTERILLDWNADNSPPLSAGEVRQKVENAFRYGQSEPGSKHPAAMFDAESLPGPTPDWKDEPDQSTLLADFAQAQAASGNRWDYTTKNQKVFGDGKATNKTVAVLKTTRSNLLNMFVCPDYGTFKNPYRDMLYLNSFTGWIEFLRRAPWHHDHDISRVHWRDVDNVMLRTDLDERYGLEFTKDVINDAVVAYTYKRQMHPIKGWLEALKWDGVKRLDLLLPHYAGAEHGPYSRAVGRKLLIGCVARALRPGCKLDTIVVLEGDQGIGKSTFCAVLGGDYYGQIALDLRSEKDTIMAMSLCWIAEISEFVCKRASDADELKAFITREKDIIRRPYDATTSIEPRHTVMIATVNPNATGRYLQDATGNRRYLPVKTNLFRLDELRRDRDQLFAEAYAAYVTGESWWLDDPSVVAEATAEQARRVTIDPWADVLAAWMSHQRAAGVELQPMTGYEMGRDVYNKPGSQLGIGDYRRIGAAASQLGWRHERLTIDGTRNWYYLPPGCEVTEEGAKQ